MARVEAKGAGFHVHHQRPLGITGTDIEAGTDVGFEPRVTARRHARELNLAPRDVGEQHKPTRTAPRPGTLPARRRIQPGPATTPSGATLSQWARIWSDAHDVSPNSAAKYGSHLRIHILPRFGQTPLDQITRIEIAAWGKLLATRMAPASALSVLTLLSGILGEAADHGLIPDNPCRGLRLVRQGKDADRAVATPLHVRRIADRMQPLAGTLVITAAYTGMRWGELTGLAWDNVLLDQETPEIRVAAHDGALHEIGGRLWLDAPKTLSSVRRVALPPFLAAMLGAARDSARADTVFTGERGAYLRRSNFRQRVWDPAVNGVPGHAEPAWRDPITPGMTFGGLRRSHQAWMEEERIDGFVQNMRMGYATPGVGDRDTRLTPGVIHEVLTVLESRYRRSALA
jgi:integrase